MLSDVNFFDFEKIGLLDRPAAESTRMRKSYNQAAGSLTGTTRSSCDEAPAISTSNDSLRRFIGTKVYLVGHGSQYMKKDFC